MSKSTVGIVIPSNKPHKFERYAATLDKLGGLREQFQIAVVAQYPWTREKLDSHFECGEIDLFTLMPETEITHMVLWRRTGMSLLANCDYFLFMDDDHKFQDGKDKTCEQYYSEVLDWLDANQDVGALTCAGYFGGYAWGYDFKKTPKNSIIAVQKGGLFIRNIGVNTICPVHLTRNIGAMFETVFTYNVMLAGYKWAKRFNAPTYCERPGQVDGTRKSYSTEIVYGFFGNGKWVRENFEDPTWEYNNRRYPKKLCRLFEERGWEYNED